MHHAPSAMPNDDVIAKNVRQLWAETVAGSALHGASLSETSRQSSSSQHDAPDATAQELHASDAETKLHSRTAHVCANIQSRRAKRDKLHPLQCNKKEVHAKTELSNSTTHKTQHTQTRVTYTAKTEAAHTKDKCAVQKTVSKPIGCESQATPTLPPKKGSQVKSKPALPKLLIGSKAEPKSKAPPLPAEPKTETDRKDARQPTTDQIPQCNGAPGVLHGLLQNVEENLLYNQEKIKVLLNVIQDLERNKAMSEGRCSYRTGQDINNCSTCQKTACIIYSVEHDFRVQESGFQNILEALDDAEYDVPSAIPKPAQIRPRTKSRVKKLRKKCFWWL